MSDEQIRIEFHCVPIRSLDLDLHICGKNLYTMIKMRRGMKEKNLALDEPHIFDEKFHLASCMQKQNSF